VCLSQISLAWFCFFTVSSGQTCGEIISNTMYSCYSVDLEGLSLCNYSILKNVIRSEISPLSQFLQPVCSIWLVYWVNNTGLILTGMLNLFFWGRLFSIVADTKNDQNGSSRDVGGAAFALTVKVIKSQCLLEGTHSLVLNALNRVYLKLYSNYFCHYFTLAMVNHL